MVKSASVKNPAVGFAAKGRYVKGSGGKDVNPVKPVNKAKKK